MKNPLKIITMAESVYVPLQTLRIEVYDVSRKAYLVASMQSWLYQFQYLKVYGTHNDGQGNYEIVLNVMSGISSLTTILWAGEQKFEIPYDEKDRFSEYRVSTRILKKEGGVTNTISGNDTVRIPE